MDSRGYLTSAHVGRSAWLPALLAALLGLCFAETRVDGAGSPRYAQPGDISCALTLLTRDGTITAGEPLIARMEIQNGSNQEIRFWPGGTFLDVYDAKDELVAAMPRPRNMLDFMHSTGDLAPGETYSKLLIVSGLHQFESPGLYSVRVQQQGLPQEMPVLCEDAAPLQVLPYNAARLEAVCEEIFAPIRKHAAFGAIPTSVRAKAILSLRDDVVLPYLDWMAREWGSRYACRAVRRIGTPRAENLLAALAVRKDRVGKAARQALEMSLEPTDWDVRAE